MTPRRWLLAIWVCFLARAAFFCAAMPLWEGFDEWSHFGVVQRMAFRGEPLVSREAPLPRDTAASIEIVPLPWELQNFGPPSVTHDAFWKLPPEERARREAAFRAIRPEWVHEDTRVWKTYEGLQGPLSGWVMTPVLLAARHAHLATQVLLLRWWAVLIASLVIPLSYLTFRRVFESERMALGCAAVLAVFPGLLIAVGHVSNEAVAVTLFTAAIWLSVEIAADGLTRARAVGLGAALGLGMIAKAYMVTALPVVAALLWWRGRRSWWSLAVPVVTAAIAGWWYVRNLLTTGSATGMWETAVRRDAGLREQLAQIGRIDWWAVIDQIQFSHLWLGSWSTLTVRSWMYHFLYLVTAVAAVGLVRVVRTRPGVWAVLGGFFAAFWLGQLYHAITLFLVWGIATTLGAYMAAILTAEVALCAGGLRAVMGRWAVPFGALVLAALDVYATNFVALPYYAGYTAHRPNGFLATFHAGGVSWGEFAARLGVFKPEWLGDAGIGVLWAGYLAATAGLVAAAATVAGGSDRMIAGRSNQSGSAMCPVRADLLPHRRPLFSNWVARGRR